MNATQVTAYAAAVLLAGLTIGIVLHIARRAGERHFWAYLLFITANNLVGLLDLVFRYLPEQVTRPPHAASPVLLDMLIGFLVFPLMAACTFAFMVFFLGLAGSRVSGLVNWIYWVYWGLLFVGFLAAEFRYFQSGDWALTDTLNPVFNLGILAAFLYAVLYALLSSGRIENLGERKFVRGLALYYLIWFCVMFSFHTSQAAIRIDVDVLTRSILGLAYNLPPLIWISVRLRRVYAAPLAEPTGTEGLNRWLAAQNVSPREREIIHLIRQGKSNRAIKEELFISRRTVESHIYNIYKKLGIKNRVQLVCLTLEKSRESWK